MKIFFLFTFFSTFAALRGVIAHLRETDGTNIEYARQYEDPKFGCSPNEVIIRVKDIEGDVCAPACVQGVCPPFPDKDVEAQPLCGLQDARTGRKFCTLVCRGPDECPKGAKCRSLGEIGICTYDEVKEDLFKVDFTL